MTSNTQTNTDRIRDCCGHRASRPVVSRHQDVTTDDGEVPLSVDFSGIP